MRNRLCFEWVAVLAGLVLAPSLSGMAGAQTTPAAPSAASAPQPASAPGPVIDLEQAIRLALAHNPTLQSARSQILQSRAQEVTAAIRPNPVLTWDALFIPLFSPHSLTATTLNTVSEFDLALSDTIERGHKRQRRVTAARDQTRVTQAQVGDNERALTSNVAQQFVLALLAEANLTAAQADLQDFQQSVDVNQQRFRAGDISEGDFLKIRLQLLQFQSGVSAARLALVQARASLRQLLGFDAVPTNFTLAGTLHFTPTASHLDDLEAAALRNRPDLQAAQLGVVAAGSQYRLAQANGKRNLTPTFTYSHVSGLSNAGVAFNMELPLFDRNQGEIARTHVVITQAEEQRQAAQEQVLTDVRSAYEAARTGEQVVALYRGGYLSQARQSRDISAYAYQHGAASLLDFLDAERSYRDIELAYRQAVAAYMLAREQIKQSVGSRQLP